VKLLAAIIVASNASANEEDEPFYIWETVFAA
jgi:hypothetical protein